MGNITATQIREFVLEGHSRFNSGNEREIAATIAESFHLGEDTSQGIRFTSKVEWLAYLMDWAKYYKSRITDERDWSFEARPDGTWRVINVFTGLGTVQPGAPLGQVSRSFSESVREEAVIGMEGGELKLIEDRVSYDLDSFMQAIGATERQMAAAQQK